MCRVEDQIPSGSLLRIAKFSIDYHFRGRSVMFPVLFYFSIKEKEQKKKRTVNIVRDNVLVSRYEGLSVTVRLFCDR